MPVAALRHAQALEINGLGAKMKDSANFTIKKVCHEPVKIVCTEFHGRTEKYFYHNCKLDMFPVWSKQYTKRCFLDPIFSSYKGFQRAVCMTTAAPVRSCSCIKA